MYTIPLCVDKLFNGFYSISKGPQSDHNNTYRLNDMYASRKWSILIEYHIMLRSVNVLGYL